MSAGTSSVPARLVPGCYLSGHMLGGRAWSPPDMRVLLVEDHTGLARTVATGLRQEGMAVDVVFDGRDALAHRRPPITTSLCSTATSRGARRRGLPCADRAPVGKPGADADRRRHRQGPGRGTRPRRRRLSSEAVRSLSSWPASARSPSPRPVTAPNAGARGPYPRPVAPGRDPGGAVAGRSAPKEFAVFECLLAAQGKVLSSEELLNGLGRERRPIQPRSRPPSPGCEPNSATRPSSRRSRAGYRIGG